MDNVLLLIISLVGCVALFLFGMRVMSQGFMKLAGSRIRSTFRSIPQQPLPCFTVGAWVTALIQSSSATTVMAVSMVNAGLLTLAQSIAIIMGANVGTTVTAWLIALFGYAWPVGLYAIPLVVLSLPFVYSSKITWKPWGEVLMGLAILLMGFSTFIALMPAAAAGNPLADALLQLDGWGIGGVLLFVVVGLGMTVAFQSSAATIMWTLVACASGWISFPLAAGLVMGDNVGTTLTALYAARHANVSARRAAYAHLYFNLFGLVWSLFLVYPMTDWLIDPNVSPTMLAFAVAAYHTLFNLISAAMLLWFVPKFDTLLSRYLPVKDDDEEEFRLSFIHGGLLSTAELSVEEARKESVNFGRRCQRMLDITDEFIHMPQAGEEHSHMYSRIEKYEKITDRLELEITRYLNSLDKSSISQRIAVRIRSLFKICDELESIGDSCYNVARTVVRRRDAGITFTTLQQQNVDEMLRLTREDLALMVQLMQKHDLDAGDLDVIMQKEETVNTLRADLREQNIKNVQAGEYTYQSGTLYMDLVNELERLCDYVVNVVEALDEQSSRHFIV